MVLAGSRWCGPGNVAGKEHLCTPDVEFLSTVSSSPVLPADVTSPGKMPQKQHPYPQIFATALSATL